MPNWSGFWDQLEYYIGDAILLLSAVRCVKNYSFLNKNFQRINKYDDKKPTEEAAKKVDEEQESKLMVW